MTLSASDFELLLQANRILSSKLDSADVLQAVMELATKVVRAEASSLLLLDAATNELYVDVALGSVKEEVKQIRLKLGEGIAGWVGRERKPLIVNDVTKDARFTQKVDKSTSFRTKSILAMPLLAKGKLIGVVEAINKELNGTFTEQDREAFEVFSNQAAVAIENARLFSEVTREKEKLKTVLAEMSDGVLLLDGDGCISLMNDAAGSFFGVTPAQAIGRAFDSSFADGFESSPSIDAVVESSNESTAVDLSRQVGKDLILSALFLRLEPDSDGKSSGHLVILRDVTTEKRGEMLKRNFLSLISHKLKTPLTVILGYAPMLKANATGLSDAQKKALSAICDQGANLGGLVDKLLRFTIVESDSLERKLELKDLVPLAREAAHSIAEDNLADGSVEIKVNAPTPALPSLMIDGALTTEVFKNLIENAVKFNDKRKKNVTVDFERDGNWVIAHVRDNGVGIPPEEQGKVFEKFHQVENSFTGQVPGAGLGLALCKKVMEAMGGRISLTSEIGKGTDVAVAFPFKKKLQAVAC